MNGTPGGTITIGTRLFFDGGLWEVTELTATAVVMRDALGGLRQASISGLLADPATRLLDAAPAEPAPAEPGTSGLTPPETEEMRRLAGHVLEVLTGYQRGGEALALPGEPRPQYAPGTAKLQRCQAKAAELGVSVMTVRRMIWRFEANGPEGLADRRSDPASTSTSGAWPTCKGRRGSSSPWPSVSTDGTLGPVGGRFALSFEKALFGWVGGQLDGAVVGGDGCVTPPCTGEEIGARGVVGLVVLE